MNLTILRFDSIDSTNTEALNQARRGAAEGLCVVARQQTAGRGRHGRTWVSAKDAGIYFSIVLRPAIETRYLPLVTFAGAVAVYETLRTCAIEPDIKWANDVHVGGRKICGILAETCESPQGMAVILGIGINLKASNIPADLTGIATSLEAETGFPVNFDEVLGRLTQFVSHYYSMLLGAGGPEKIRRAWAARSSYFEGKKVRVALDEEIIYGTTRGIEENGALRVELDDGRIRIIHAGDVTQVRAT